MTDLKRLADRLLNTQSAIDFNEAVIEAMQLIELASEETVGTLLVEIGYAEACNNRNAYACRLALAAARKERAALQRAIDEMQSRVGQLRNEVNCRIEHGADGRGHLEYVQAALSDILRPHATRREEAKATSHYDDDERNVPPAPADDTRELVARLAEVVERMSSLPDGLRSVLEAIIRDAKGGAE